MKIAEGELMILGRCKTDGNVLYLPNEQLDRKTYEAVNKCLVAIGGKWDRKSKGHVFDHDPADDLDSMLLTGEVTDTKKLYQFFPTPRPIAEQMCDLAELDSTCTVLEPSCGRGDLADVIYERGVAEVFGVELNQGMERYLHDKPYACMVGVDFLEFARDENHYWDRIVMNPPFAHGQDVQHVLAAYKLLASAGVLVSVMSPSPFFRDNKASVGFREWLREVYAEVIDVPEGAFKDSGTTIRTKIVKIKR